MTGLPAHFRAGSGTTRFRWALWFFRFTAVATPFLVFFALRRWGANEVRVKMADALFLTVIGVFWLLVVCGLFSWMGLSWRDDVLERQNTSALIARIGGLIAAALIYVEGSFGNGPSFFENYFSAGLATATFMILWILLEVGGQISISIAEERDAASGLRLAGYLIALGLILGRAVAGDWHSVTNTIHDFMRDGWPALALAGSAIVVERNARPNRSLPFPPWPSHGFIPALAYIAVAFCWLRHLGPWEGMP